MTYLAHVNQLITQTIRARPRFVSFGQNIGAGSHLSGLTRDLPRGPHHHVLNMPNCENALAGFGFGLMLEGVDCAFFCKQLDFLLLSCDQIVNTHNMVRLRSPSASYSIVCIVVDSGFEGPQSRLNNLADFASLADIPVFSVANGPDAEAVFDKHLIAPGFRIIAVSQRLFRSEIASATADFADVGGDARILRHAVGSDATIVSFNFAWPQATEIGHALAARGLSASLYSVAGLPVTDWSPLVDAARRSGRLILVDDSRTRSRAADGLRAAVAEAGLDCRVVPLYRPIRDEDVAPHSDRFAVDLAHLFRSLEFSTVN